MKSFKVKILNKEHSLAIQRRVIELGYKWNCDVNEEGCYEEAKKHINAHKDGGITHLNLYMQYPSVTLTDLYRMEPEKKELSKSEKIRMFENMAKPLMGFLRDHFDATTVITIENDRAALSKELLISKTI